MTRMYSTGTGGAVTRYCRKYFRAIRLANSPRALISLALAVYSIRGSNRMLTCGIDFGTSNSLAAIARPEGIVVCEVDPANGDPQLLPSLLYFSRYGWGRVGRAATHAYQADPDGRFIRALKSALPEVDPEERFR